MAPGASLILAPPPILSMLKKIMKKEGFTAAQAQKFLRKFYLKLPMDCSKIEVYLSIFVIRELARFVDKKELNFIVI